LAISLAEALSFKPDQNKDQGKKSKNIGRSSALDRGDDQKGSNWHEQTPNGNKAFFTFTHGMVFDANRLVLRSLTVP
jgi:hypothetical protein